MKKKILAGALALALLGGCLAAGAAGQSGALVSLSYLKGLFWNDLKDTVKQETDKDTSYLYSEAAAQAGQEGGAFAERACASGDVLTAPVGCVMVWISGTALVRSGTLVDATTGAEVNAGGKLTQGHRYLAGTDVAVTAFSAGRWMGEGGWTVTAGDPTELPFTDVPEGVWYRDDVAYVYRNGLFNGQTSTTFAPGNKMSRGMVTTVLHRLAGEPAVSYSAMFRDVPDGKWYTKGAIWAGELGVVNGTGNNRFSPSGNVSRQEIAVILYRYAQKAGYDTSRRADLSAYSDYRQVASWGREAMSWAVGAGILNGTRGALRPTGDATRSEVAALFHRFDLLIKQQ